MLCILLLRRISYFLVNMIISASILIVLSALGFILVLQMNFNSLKKKHFEEMAKLQSKASNLMECQNQLAQKIVVLNTFSKEYKNSREHINQEILALIHDFLKNNNKI